MLCQKRRKHGSGGWPHWTRLTVWRCCATSIPAISTFHDRPVDQIGTIARLAQFDVRFAIDYAQLIRVYVRYLRDEGFLPANTRDAEVM